MPRHLVVFVLLMLARTSGDAAAKDDWLEFRGPTGQGLSEVAGLPVRWSPTENVAWRKEIPGKGWSSPVLHDGRLYLTTAVGETDDGPQSLRTLCLDAKSGASVWNVEVFRQAGGVAIHEKNSHASSTPILDAKTLFVHFGTHGTAALDLGGKILWKNEDLKYIPVHGNGGSPALVEDLLVINCDGADVKFVAALDRKDGKIRWKTPRQKRPANGFSFSTPLLIDVDGKKQLISAGSGAVFAYDPRDGRELWWVDYGDGYSVVPRPVYGNGLLFVCTGYNTPSLLAIRPAGASGDATKTHVVWQVKRAMPLNPSPLLVGDALYVISDDGILTCLDAATGKQNWQKRAGGNYSASPLYAGGVIYLQSEAGEGIVFKADPAQYEEVSRNTLGERALASYAVGEGALYVRSLHHIARVENR